MSRSIRTLLLLLSSASSILAQQAAQTAASAENKATLQGQVLNALTGEPVRRAELHLMKVGTPGAMMSPGGQPPGSQTVATDASGRFAISDIEPGSYMLSAQKSGFVPMQYGARRANSGGTTIAITAGQELKDIQFKLLPQAIISGRVTDDEGEPVQDASVQALAPYYMRGRRQMMPRGMAQTNDRGEYRLANLPPGKYLLAVRMMRPPAPVTRRAADSAPEMGFAATYYPGVTELSQAARIDVIAGGELAGFDIRLQKTRVFRVKGKVFDPSGVPVKGAMVTLSPKSGLMDMMFGGGGSGPEGSFELANVAPGSYNVVVRSRSSEGGPGMFQQFPLEVVDKDIDGLELRTGARQSIAGKVTVENNEPANFDAFRINLVPADGSMMFNSPSTQLKHDGTFTLENVVSAKYKVMLFGVPQGGYVASLQAGGQELPGGDLDCAAGCPASLEVTISMAGAQISGTVVNKDAAAPGATVLLAPDESKRAASYLFKTTNTDQNGGFTLKGVAPGDYRVFAFDTVEYGAWEDPDFIRQYEDKGATVKVQKKSTETARLSLILTDAK